MNMRRQNPFRLVKLLLLKSILMVKNIVLNRFQLMGNIKLLQSPKNNYR